MASSSSSCNSCSKATKYTCIDCGYHYCIPCSVFEEDEEVPGWMAGRCVARCEACFRELMEENYGGDVNVKGRQTPEGTDENPQNGKKRKIYDLVENDDDRQSRQPHNDREDDDDDDDDDDLDEDMPVSGRASDIFKKKASNKKGRKSMWKPEEVNDLVDVIISKEYYKKKLIFTNTKNQKNGQIYDEIAKELQERAAARGQEFLLVAKQLRIKFKNLVSICKNAALTVKTGTGIKRFQDDKGYGNWFNALFPVVRTRDSCQPDQAIEPSSDVSRTATSSPSGSSSSSTSKEDSSEPHTFVPIKRAKKASKEASMEQAIEMVKEAVSNDPTKQLIDFMKEEMEKSRQHELQLFQMLMQPSPSAMPMQFSPTQSAGHFQQVPSHAAPPYSAFQTRSPPSFAAHTMPPTHSENSDFCFSNGNVYHQM